MLALNICKELKKFVDNMDWKHIKYHLGGQQVDLSLKNQKYDKEHQVATRWSHAKENDKSQWEVRPKGHQAKSRWVKTW
jgi:hypothetical protein